MLFRSLIAPVINIITTTNSKKMKVVKVYGDTLRALSCLESSPLTRRWILCSSLLASFSEQVFGEIEEMVDERLVTSEVESRVAETGLVAMPSPFNSAPPPAMDGMAVVSKVLSGTLMGMEYGLYLRRGRTAFRNGCRWTEEEAAEDAAAAAAM